MNSHNTKIKKVEDTLKNYVAFKMEDKMKNDEEINKIKKASKIFAYVKGYEKIKFIFFSIIFYFIVIPLLSKFIGSHMDVKDSSMLALVCGFIFSILTNIKGKRYVLYMRYRVLKNEVIFSALSSKTIYDLTKSVEDEVFQQRLSVFIQNTKCVNVMALKRFLNKQYETEEKEDE